MFRITTRRPHPRSGTGLRHLVADGQPVRHAGVPGRGGAVRPRRAPSTAIWVGEHVVTFEHYASRYPYAEDGQMPIPPGIGPARTVHDPGLPGRGSRRRSAWERPCACCRNATPSTPPRRSPPSTGCRRAASTSVWAWGGCAKSSRPSTWRGNDGGPHRRVPRGAADPVVRRPLVVLGDVLHAAPVQPCTPSRSSIPTPRSTSAARASAALRRAARAGQGWHTFDRAPDDLPDAVARLDASAGRARTQPRRRRGDGVPYFKPLDAAITEQYAEAGADAVSALFFAMSAEDVPAMPSRPSTPASSGPGRPDRPDDEERRPRRVRQCNSLTRRSAPGSGARSDSNVVLRSLPVATRRGVDMQDLDDGPRRRA